MFIEFNPNPNGVYVGDCVIRAICKAFDQEWHKTYLDVCVQGYMMCDMPSSNNVWGAYLKKKGFVRSVIPNSCPDCYTVMDFCDEHHNGVFILATGTHVVTVVNGDYYDSWDSGSEVPIYYWTKGENNGV